MMIYITKSVPLNELCGITAIGYKTDTARWIEAWERTFIKANGEVLQMVLNINSKEYSNENYECNIYINNVRFHNDAISEEVLLPCTQGDIITIEYRNIIFEENKGYFYILLYWFFSLISGYGERHPFGYPFSTVVKIKVLQTEKGILNINSNSIWEATPFRVSGDAEILENAFRCPKEYRKKWWLGEVVPMYTLAALILLIFSLIDVTIYLKLIFFMIPIAIGGWWTWYVMRMSNKIYRLAYQDVTIHS